MGATGLKVWPAAQALAKYAVSVHGVAGKRVLELASGAGALGLTCAAAGADRVVLSDRLLPKVDVSGNSTRAGEFELDPAVEDQLQLELLKHNVSLNEAAGHFAYDKVGVVQLDLSSESEVNSVVNDHGPFDVILVSDLGLAVGEFKDSHRKMASGFAALIAAHGLVTPKVFNAEGIRTPGVFESWKACLHEVGLSAELVHDIPAKDEFSLHIKITRIDPHFCSVQV